MSPADLKQLDWALQPYFILFSANVKPTPLAFGVEVVSQTLVVFRLEEGLLQADRSRGPATHRAEAPDSSPNSTHRPWVW